MPGFEETNWFYDAACWAYDNHKAIIGTLGAIAGLGIGIWIGYKRDHPTPNPSMDGDRRGPERKLEKST